MSTLEGVATNGQHQSKVGGWPDSLEEYGLLGKIPSWVIARYASVAAWQRLVVMDALTELQEPPPQQFMWRLARKFKGAIEKQGEQDLDQYEKQKLRSAVLMFREAVIELGWSCELSEGDWSETSSVWLEFIDCWDQAELPEGTDSFEMAAKSAIKSPLRLTERAKESWAGDDDLRRQLERVLSIGLHLQRRRGKKNIMLPVARVAQVLDSNDMHASRLIRRGCRTGCLERVKEASFSRHRAAEYRFLLDRRDVFIEAP